MCVHVCMYVCIVCMYVCMYVCMVCMYVCMYRMYVCMYVCIYPQALECLCVCVCVCVSSYYWTILFFYSFFLLHELHKYSNKQALECFLHIVNTPPAPRTAADVYLQVGHVHELQNQYDQAMDAYTKG